VASAAIPHQRQGVKDAVAQERIRWTTVAFFVVLLSEILLGLSPRNPLNFADLWIASGTISLVLGLLIRTWAAGTLVKKKRLISDGPYALVRHPLYLGSILLMLGFTLLTGMWWNVVAAGVIAIVSFGGAIRREERFLADKFGEEWAVFAAARGRLVPRRVAGAFIAPWHRKRWLKNREFNAWLGACLGWLALLAWYQLCG
jgi:protein-S-isoprenylcysteine O-methyltransferase Ste14